MCKATIGPFELAFSLLFFISSVATINDRPVVGILAQEYYGTIPNKTSYIAASYVKWVESAGARVLPIFINQTDEYYDEVLSLVNGVLFPGGAVYIDKTGYGNAGCYLYKRIKELNNKGFMPLWGTCLGMELILFAHLERKNVLTRCKSNDKALPVVFTNEKGQLFRNAPSDIIRVLESENVTINYHNWCLTTENLTKYSLDNDFVALSMNNDSQGIEFISIMEHKTQPVYLTQFHPEKNTFEWVNNAKHHNIPHFSNAVMTSNFFAQFFVNQTRLNEQRFPEDRADRLIYSYPVTNTANNSIYVQCYLFE